MTSGMRTIILPVNDLDAAKQLYSTLLGVAPSTDQPYYVGFDVGDQTLGLDPNGHGKGMTGPVGYWHVDDIEATVARLVESGAEVVEAVNKVGPGRRIATLKDADGNPFGLLEDTGSD